MPPESSGFKPLPDVKLIHEKAKRGSGNHILTGPIYVKDAKVGDVLEVRILDIALRQNWGFNLFRSYGGTLPDDFPYYRLIHVALDKASNMAILPSGLKVPMAPFFGQLAVAPAKAIVWSLPITRAQTCIMLSHITGFTLPGMIDEPG